MPMTVHSLAWDDLRVSSEQDGLSWTFSDAWLLTAIGQSGQQGSSLSELIGAADALNHDVPTEAQASSSLGRLIASGLLEVADGRYRMTREGRSVYKRRQGGMFELSGSVLVALESIQCVDGKVEFGDGEFQTAYEDYVRR
jgi:hypothetical protein